MIGRAGVIPSPVANVVNLDGSDLMSAEGNTIEIDHDQILDDLPLAFQAKHSLIHHRMGSEKSPASVEVL